MQERENHLKKGLAVNVSSNYGGDAEHQGSGQIIPKKYPTWGLREPKGDVSLSKACETWSSPTATTMRAPALFIQHVACLWAPPLPLPERQGRKQLASALPWRLLKHSFT